VPKAMFYVIYDLIKVEDQPKLVTRLEHYEGRRIMLSVWVLAGPYTPKALLDDLSRYIDKQDRLLVVQSDSSGWTMNMLANPNDL